MGEITEVYPKMQDRLPNNLDLILSDLGIRSENRQFLNLTLSHKHAIERISVMIRESVDPERMTHLDRQTSDRV